MRIKNTIKENISNILWFLFLFILLIGFIGGIFQIDKQMKDEENKKKDFIENCINNNGKIDLKANYLICYPINN